MALIFLLLLLVGCTEQLYTPCIPGDQILEYIDEAGSRICQAKALPGASSRYSTRTTSMDRCVQNNTTGWMAKFEVKCY